MALVSQLGAKYEQQKASDKFTGLTGFLRIDRIKGGLRLIRMDCVQAAAPQSTKFPG
jgi:hypothetical protein